MLKLKRLFTSSCFKFNHLFYMPYDNGCRRRFPNEIYSDNGTNFVGREKSIKRMSQRIRLRTNNSLLHSEENKWGFQSTHGATYGRSVGKVNSNCVQKKILKFLRKEKYPKEYVLRTLLYSRTSIQLDSIDDEP